MKDNHVTMPQPTPKKGPSRRICEILSLSELYMQSYCCGALEAFGRAKRGYDLTAPDPEEPNTRPTAFDVKTRP